MYPLEVLTTCTSEWDADWGNCVEYCQIEPSTGFTHDDRYIDTELQISDW